MTSLATIADEIAVQLRPSNLARLDACPGSALAVALMAVAGIRARSNAFADKGTANHAATAAGILFLVERWSAGDPSSAPTPDEWPESAAPMMSDAALTRVLLKHATRDDLWMVRASLVVTGKLVRKYGVTPDNVLVEQRLDDCGLGLPNGGTADLVLVLPFRVLVIVDWKYGYNEVESAELNDQGAAYAIMGAATFQTETVHVYIHLPRGDVRLHRAAYGVAELADRATHTRAIIAGALAPNPPRRASLDACRYCPGLGRCAEARTYVEKQMHDYATFGPVTTAEWSTVLNAARLAEKWAEAVKDDLKEIREKDPTFIPDGNIVTKTQVIRTVADFPSLYGNAIAAGVGATVLELAKGISVSALEEAEIPPAVYGALVVESQRAGYLKASKVSKA